jgi:hypothetical protein
MGKEAGVRVQRAWWSETVRRVEMSNADRGAGDAPSVWVERTSTLISRSAMPAAVSEAGDGERGRDGPATLSGGGARGLRGEGRVNVGSCGFEPISQRLIPSIKV